MPIVELQLNKFLEDEEINKKITSKIPSKKFILIYNTENQSVENDRDLTQFITNKEKFDESFKTTKDHKYVYLLFIKDVCYYVGKAVDIKTRLKNHLFKCSKSTQSKIEKIAELLKKKGEIEIGIVVMDISPTHAYSMVEGILIEALGTTNHWNEKES